jgi:methylglutaconyl-CoA hydratase
VAPSFETLRIDRRETVARVVLNRPDIRNAFDDVMIRELREALAGLRDDPRLRVVVLTGEGQAFCAGADLNWMKRVVEYTAAESEEDSLNLARLMREAFEFPRPIVGRINGPAIGGGTGLVAICDIAVAAESAVFSFSEVKIGLVPAVISPYVVRRVGERYAREYFITGRRLSAADALACGLVNAVVPDAQLETKVSECVNELLSSGPEAVASAKRLVREIAELSLDEAGPKTARLITELRLSAEGQEGMKAFLERRPPAWRASPM